jgi:hypothetical protein
MARRGLIGFAARLMPQMIGHVFPADRAVVVDVLGVDADWVADIPNLVEAAKLLSQPHHSAGPVSGVGWSRIRRVGSPTASTISTVCSA